MQDVEPLPWAWSSNISSGAVVRVETELVEGYGMGGQFGAACRWTITPSPNVDYTLEREDLPFSQWPANVRALLENL